LQAVLHCIEGFLAFIHEKILTNSKSHARPPLYFTRRLFQMKRMAMALILIGCIMLPVSPLPAQEPPLMAGAFKIKITPARPVYLAGYDENRLSEGVHDDLYASALVLKKGPREIALVSLDLMGLANLYITRIRQMVRSIPGDNVLIASTHTHSGPDTFGQWGPAPDRSGVDQEYLEELLRRVAECVDKAASDLKEARVKFATVTGIEGVSYNARVREILDTDLAAMQVVTKDGKNIALLVNYACHPEVLNNKLITADFPGYLYRRIESKLGGIGMYMNGAQGGMITAVMPHPDQKDDWANAERIGNLLADKAMDALAKAPDLDASFDLKRAVFEVPLENEGFKALIRAGILPDIAKDGKVTTEVSHLAVGPAQFVTIPGEALPNIGFLLKRYMKGEPKFVLGLCGDELGYILSEEDYGLKLYSYETSVSVGSQIGPQVVANLKSLIAAFKPLSTSGPAVARAGAVREALEKWFDALPQAVSPEAASHLTAVYQFILTGPEGGNWIFRLQDGKPSSSRGQTEKPDVTFEATATDWLDIASGKLDGMQAFMSGHLKVEGDMELARRFQSLFQKPDR